jgi:hypothetical protein
MAVKLFYIPCIYVNRFVIVIKALTRNSDNHFIGKKG